MASPDARIRAFAALEIGNAARAALSDLIQRLRPIPARISWVRPENLHVTLRFLGMVTQDQINLFVERLSASLTQVSPFDAAVRGVGMFPNAGRPSVIWAGMDGDTRAFAAVHSAAEQAARAVGLEPEGRDFIPHITLGRVRRDGTTASIAPYLDAERDFDAGAFAVDGVSLFSSELTPHGARYTRLYRLTLDG